MDIGHEGVSAEPFEDEQNQFWLSMSILGEKSAAW